ncbi:MAG: MarR family transcriptional regulator [Candidatus Aminicenantes bacterium]|nr:MarR family transcriptional regulator [Candidatus Aminicenantes bacterium]
MNREQLSLFREKLRHLERELIELLKEDNVCCGVSVSQCHILLEVGGKRETSIVDLASKLNLDTSTLSRSIDGLVSIGLVDRQQNPNDRRYVNISLSKQGKQVYSSIEKANNAYFSKIFRLIPEDKHDQIIKSFLLFFEAMKVVKENKCFCGEDPKKGKER